MCRSILFILVFNIVSFFGGESYAIESISSENIQLADENIILTEVFVEKIATSEIVEIYQYDGGFLVPLGLLSDILEFSVEVDSEQETANGWFIRENRIFSLDVVSG